MTVSPGTKIKELRLLAGLSQEELGRRVGVQRAAINKYEKGTVTNIPLQTIEKIASTLDVSPTYIVGWDQPNHYNELAMEVKVIQGIKQFYGKDAVELLEMYLLLSAAGKKRVFQYINEVSAIYGDANE